MPIRDALVDIVGADRVSNDPAELFIYSRDSGAQPPGRADFVVLPKTAEEISAILRLANREKIPVTPVGAGLTLSGIVVPERGGIVLDMKRMDRILEVDELNRYVVIEAGVSQGGSAGVPEKAPSALPALHPGGAAHRNGDGQRPDPRPRPHLAALRDQFGYDRRHGSGAAQWRDHPHRRLRP